MTPPIRRASEKRTFIQYIGPRITPRLQPKANSNPPESQESDQHTMADQGFKLKALAGLHSDEISKLDESLQGLAFSRLTTTPAQAPSATEP